MYMSGLVALTASAFVTQGMVGPVVSNGKSEEWGPSCEWIGNMGSVCNLGSTSITAPCSFSDLYILH